MATRNATEVVTGAAVLVLAGGFLAYALAHTGAGTTTGYPLTAKFDDISGISVGSDVRIGGVKVGTVTATNLDPKTYQALVTLEVKKGLEVPKDSSAVVTTDGLLGGKYVAIQPGGDEKLLGPGGRITVTQGSISLEALLGKFIFNSSSGKSAAAASPSTAPAAPPSAGGLPSH